jgi:hypothetical protein
MPQRKNPRETRITIRLSEAEYYQVETAVATRGISREAIVRWALTQTGVIIADRNADDLTDLLLASITKAKEKSKAVGA